MHILTIATLPAGAADPIFTSAQLTALLQQPHHHVFTTQGAYVVVHLPPQGVADVLTLATPPAQRRQGLAMALMQHTIAQARSAGCTALTLEVRASNTPAIALYQACGLQQVATRSAYYSHPTEDALVYSSSFC